jgi:hypothetical protein
MRVPLIADIKIASDEKKRLSIDLVKGKCSWYVQTKVNVLVNEKTVA